MAETQYPVAGDLQGRHPASDTLPESASTYASSVASTAPRPVTHHDLAAHIVRPATRSFYRRMLMTNKDDGPRATA